MGLPLELLLHHVASRKVIVGFDVLLNLLAQVADNEDNLLDRHILQLVEDVAEDRLASARHQRLGLGEGMGLESGAAPRQGNDDLHA
jgi:hypothetical protein